MSHGDKVTRYLKTSKLPVRLQPVQLLRCLTKNRRFYGVQFHPEVTHTKKRFGIVNEFRGEHLWL